MGFFGGKKNKVSKPEAEAAAQPGTQRKSRRIVTPGLKGTVAAAPAARAPESPAPSATPPRPGTARFNGKPAVAPGGTARVSDRRPTADAGLMLGGDAKPGTQSIDRPKSREPIQASAPLTFAGDLASGTRSGPARTGDTALVEFLTGKANLLNADQAAQVRTKAQQSELPIDSAAVELGFLTEDQLVSALTQECWVPHLKVDKYEIRKKALDTIAREDATHYGVFPVDKLGSLLTLAMVNPLDAETIRVLESKTGLDIKKVVATRTEINQGIEKYYSGQVVAKDTSMAFTQDVEPKSVTQMLSSVAVKETTAVVNRTASKPAVPAPKHDSDIIPEIQDIDDLLSSDEVIAPAIIEPIGIEPIGIEPIGIEAAALSSSEIEPMQIDVAEIESANDELAEIAISDPAASAAAKAAVVESGLLDLDVDISPPSAPLAPAAVAASAGADHALFASPSLPLPPVAPVKSAKPAIPAPGPTAKPAVGKAVAAASAPVFVNLVPVMEEEFQHAITHGKAHVFEKWVGLQTRNRIINGVPVEAELERVLGSLYASPRR